MHSILWLDWFTLIAIDSGNVYAVNLFDSYQKLGKFWCQPRKMVKSGFYPRNVVTLFEKWRICSFHLKLPSSVYSIHKIHHFDVNVRYVPLKNTTNSDLMGKTDRNDQANSIWRLFGIQPCCTEYPHAALQSIQLHIGIYDAEILAQIPSHCSILDTMVRERDTHVHIHTQEERERETNTPYTSPFIRKSIAMQCTALAYFFVAFVRQ